MPRYVRQRDEFRCGPIAILNALKWAGRDVTARLVPKLCREVSCIPPGTGPMDLTRGLFRRGKGIFFTRQDMRPSLKGIEERLREGQAVLLSYWYYKEKPPSKCGELEMHYTLIVGVSSGGLTFYVANYFVPDNTQRQRISRRMLRNNLRDRRQEGIQYHARAWYLTARSGKAR